MVHIYTGDYEKNNKYYKFSFINGLWFDKIIARVSRYELDKEKL